MTRRWKELKQEQRKKDERGKNQFCPLNNYLLGCKRKARTRFGVGSSEWNLSQYLKVPVIRQLRRHGNQISDAKGVRTSASMGSKSEGLPDRLIGMHEFEKSARKMANRDIRRAKEMVVMDLKSDPSLSQLCHDDDRIDSKIGFKRHPMARDHFLFGLKKRFDWLAHTWQRFNLITGTLQEEEPHLYHRWNRHSLLESWTRSDLQSCMYFTRLNHP